MLIRGCLIVIFFLCEQSVQFPLTPDTFDLKLAKKDPALLPQPLVITKPEEKEDISTFLNIWENRFSSQSDVSFSAKDEGSEGAPKTILAVTFPKMINLIPQDAPHPLYSPSYEKLTDDFILDSLSAQTIDFNDPQLKSIEGVTIKTMGGKDLVFKKDQNTNKFTVNGVEIEKHSTITGNTNVVIMSDFLFDYYNAVQTAFDELLKSAAEVPETKHEVDGSGTSGSNPGFRAEGLEVVPPIPESVKDPNTGVIPSSFLNIWEHRLSNIGETLNTNLRNEESAPKTILAVTFSKMVNLIPQDAPHPLYSSSYAKLTDDFLLDSFSAQTIDFNDQQLTSPQGVTIKSMNGKDLLFRKDQRKNVFTVNSIEVDDHQTLPDGTVVVIINDFLFNNYDEVQKAFHELSQQPGAPSLGDFHGIGKTPVPNFNDESESPPSGPCGVNLPVIPDSFSTSFENDKFLNLWKFRLSKLQESIPHNTDSRVPQTILPVAFFKMINLIPRDAPNPLYTTDYQTLADEFILDSLSTDKVDFEDPNLTSPEGVTIKTMTGKDLVFKRDAATDKITVNGIDIDKHQLLSDQKTVVVLSDFLFNYYDVIQKAFQEYQNKPKTTGAKRSTLAEPETKSGTESQTELEPSTGTNYIPNIPEILEAGDKGAEDANGLVNIWRSRLSDVKSTPGFTRAVTSPKTVLAVDPLKMINLIPQDAPHPLYSHEFKELTDRFILDSISPDEINFEDPKLSTPEGVTIKTLGGKDLKFTKDQNSNSFQVNGITVTSHKVLNGNTNLIIIQDYLFNIYDEVQNAFQELLKSNSNTGLGLHPHPIPSVPAVLEGPDVGIDASGLLNVWEKRLSNFGLTSASDIAIEDTPKTIIAVTSIKMINLIPQDAPNPLYTDEYQHLTNEFILDSLSSETIHINDPNLLKNGVTIITLNGHDLVFKKEETTNKLTINGVNVENNKTFEDGTSVFIIGDFLFDYYNGIRSAFDSLQQRKSPQPEHTPF